MEKIDLARYPYVIQVITAQEALLVKIQTNFWFVLPGRAHSRDAFVRGSARFVTDLTHIEPLPGRSIVRIDVYGFY